MVTIKVRLRRTLVATAGALRSMSSMSRAFIILHLAWATRARGQILTPELDGTLAGILHDSARRVACKLLAMGAARDHVHVVALLNPSVAAARLVQRLKGASAFECNRRALLRRPLRWQVGYFAESVSPSDLDPLLHYVRNQRTHHDASHPNELWLESAEGGL